MKPEHSEMLIAMILVMAMLFVLLITNTEEAFQIFAAVMLVLIYIETVRIAARTKQ